MAKKRESDRLKPLSMPLDVNDALRGAMEVPAPEEAKPKKRKRRKAKKKRKKK